MLQSYQEVIDRCEQIKAHPFSNNYHLQNSDPSKLSQEDQEIRSSGIQLVDQFLLDVMPSQTIDEHHPDLLDVKERVKAVINLTEIEDKSQAAQYYAGIWDQEHELVRSVIAIRTALQMYALPINGLLNKPWSDFVHKAKYAMIDS